MCKRQLRFKYRHYYRSNIYLGKYRTKAKHPPFKLLFSTIYIGTKEQKYLKVKYNQFQVGLYSVTIEKGKEMMVMVTWSYCN